MTRLTLMGLAALSVAGGLAACDDEPTGPKPGESFTLAVGESAALDTIQASLRFLAVSEDSRCPLRAQCVWAGDGAVLLEIAPADGDAAEHTLHTNPESGPGSMLLAGFELTLLALEPYPDTPGEIEPDEYRATLALYERLEEPTE